jgi:hypothetical protein
MEGEKWGKSILSKKTIVTVTQKRVVVTTGTLLTQKGRKLPIFTMSPMLTN